MKCDLIEQYARVQNDADNYPDKFVGNDVTLTFFSFSLFSRLLASQFQCDDPEEWGSIALGFFRLGRPPFPNVENSFFHTTSKVRVSHEVHLAILLRQLVPFERQLHLTRTIATSMQRLSPHAIDLMRFVCDLLHSLNRRTNQRTDATSYLLS